MNGKLAHAAGLSPERQAAFDAEQARKVREVKPIELKTDVRQFDLDSLVPGISPEASGLPLLPQRNAYQFGVGCEETRLFYGITQMDPATSSSQEARNLLEMYQTLCIGRHRDGDTVRYSNNRIATLWANQVGATWYYPNGETATNWAGEETATWYYSNRTTVSNWAIRPGSSWYHTTGRVATHWARQSGATWYYSNGSDTITSWSGRVGATWNWHNRQLLSSSMGSSSATWYRPDGSIWYSSGPTISANELLDPPLVFLVYLTPGVVVNPGVPPINENSRRVSYSNFANSESGETFFEVWGSFFAGDIPRVRCCPSREVVNGNCNWRNVTARRTFPTRNEVSAQLNFAVPQTNEVQTCLFTIGSSSSSSDTTASFPLRIPRLEVCAPR